MALDRLSQVTSSGISTTISFRAAGINVSGIVTATTFVGALTGNASSATIATYTSEWILGANGSLDYTFTGPGFTGAENDPVLYLVRGQQYKFTNTMGAHPFRIQSTVNGSTGTQYNDGITNNDVSNGTLTWDVQFDAPNLLYYQCTAHGSMGGKIYILNSEDNVSAGTTSAPSISPSGDSNTGIFFPSADTIAFAEGGAEAMRIDSSSRLLVGTSSARGNLFNTTATAQLQSEGTTNDTSTTCLVQNNSAGTDGPRLVLGKSNGSSVGSNTIVASGNGLGIISFQGNDGSEFVDAASIKAEVDGTPGANDMPGRIVLSTTAVGASSPTERMRIGSVGFLKASNDGTYHAAGGSYHEFRQSISNSASLVVTASNGSYVGNLIHASTVRAATNAYSLLKLESGTFTDAEFNFAGNGNAFADGSFSGGGADYAEYFEWSDSNPDEEDRRGISVVLDGDKIREAVAGEDPIGVISGNPSVVGDAAWNKWSGKYLRDEFGTYIQEDYEVEDEDGNTVIQQRRKLNPAYDPEVEYLSREERPEWDCVGLMGKLRIRKGQVTGSRWIKMRDISDSVEEWLVR